MRYRHRKDDRQSHIEFDWLCKDGATLKNLRYFAQWDRIYCASAQNWRTRVYYTLYGLTPELEAHILAECKGKFK